MALSDIRKTYEVGALDERSVDPDPLKQFRTWLNEALATDLIEPTAMTLATADLSGRPSSRLVLLKGLDECGFVFYSNYSSRKGRELAVNPQAALSFYWGVLERQVRVEGRVSKVSREVSRTYFDSRPYGSRLGALASPQSEVVARREVLQEKLVALKEQYPDEVPLPEHWGGYALEPDRIEFWQGRPDRLHDRLRYVKEGEGWRVERLAP